MIELKLPSVELFPAFQNFLDEMTSKGETIWASYAPRINELPEAFVTNDLHFESRE